MTTPTAADRAAVRAAALAALLAACSRAPADSAAPALTLPSPDPSCTTIFGRPSAATGLSEAACVPRIDGETDWRPTEWAPADFAALRAWSLDDPPAPPVEDPWSQSPAPVAQDGVCTAIPTAPGRYRLATLPDAEAARAAGGQVTHGGACGLCSSLADLAVYAENNDLTAPGRACGLAGITGGIDAADACFQALGFTPPCARIWAWNAAHTREACFDLCIEAAADPYNTPDGGLNPCLQCDEDESGPVFLAVAGRTRRNSGLANAMCRRCDLVWRVHHDPRLGAGD